MSNRKTKNVPFEDLERNFFARRPKMLTGSLTVQLFITELNYSGF